MHKITEILNVEFFIARRLASSPDEGRRNVMVRIATATVAIGVAVMIVALAVISGFKSEITEKIIGFGAHVQVVNLDANSSFERQPIDRSPSLEERVRALPLTASISQFAVKGGIVRTSEAMQGVMLKGVGEGYDDTFFTKSLVRGALPRVGGEERHKDLLISESLASMLRLDTASKVEMLFVQEDGRPRRDRFKVCGIYSTGMGEMDDMIVVTELRNVQRLNSWSEEQITGYEINCRDFSRLTEFATDIDRIAAEVSITEGANLMADDIERRFPTIFDWLRAHNVNAVVIIVIMITVALMNMISAMLIILLERTRMIGLLKAMGMRNGAIQRVFLYRSLYIVARGALWGNAIGLAICALQRWGHIIKLDPSGYMLSEVPISVELWWWLLLNVGTVAVIVLLMVIPTMIISFIKPDTTIRYQ